MITYTEEKKFDNKSVVDLFSSVGWVSAQYPTRLYKALMHSSTVITAWDGDRLVGLVRVLDDSELVAYMHYVLVHPDYHGQGIAGTMVEMVKEKYKDYLYKKSARKPMVFRPWDERRHELSIYILLKTLYFSKICAMIYMQGNPFPSP